MADFRTAVLKTLVHEGGYVNNPADKGGPTNFGITQEDMPGMDMQTITEDQAVDYYAANYWKSGYSQITSQAVANKLFDMGVLFGVGTAVRMLQLALFQFGLTVDGIFGPLTLSAVNQTEPDSLIMAMQSSFVTHIFNIAKNDPTQRQFLKGWANRINSEA